MLHRATHTSSVRAFVCLFLAISLCVPSLAAAPRPEFGHPAAASLAFADLAPSTLASRIGPRIDDARHRASGDWPVVLVSRSTGLHDPGCRVACAENACPRPHRAVTVRTGRSPPRAIS